VPRARRSAALGMRSVARVPGAAQRESGAAQTRDRRRNKVCRWSGPGSAVHRPAAPRPGRAIERDGHSTPHPASGTGANVLAYAFLHVLPYPGRGAARERCGADPGSPQKRRRNKVCRWSGPGSAVHRPAAPRPGRAIERDGRSTPHPRPGHGGATAPSPPPCRSSPPRDDRGSGSRIRTCRPW